MLIIGKNKDIYVRKSKVQKLNKQLNVEEVDLLIILQYIILKVIIYLTRKMLRLLPEA